MRIRKLHHSVYQCEYHIVFGTKYRRQWLKDYVKTELIEYLFEMQSRFPTWYFHQINTDSDHIHFRMEISPKYAVSEVVQKIKAESSQYLKKKFPFVQAIYDPDPGIWATGYFVSTIGLNEDQIRKYIEEQGKADLPIDVTSEFS